MKKLIYLLIATVFFVSCTEESNEGVKLDETSEIFNRFLESSDYETLKVNFPDLIKGIDLKTAKTSFENGVPIFTLQSKSGNESLGSILFSAFKNGTFIALVETYSKDPSGEITSFNFKSISNELLYSFDSQKTDNDSYSLTLNKKSLENDLSTSRSWWTCSRECVRDAFEACSGDGECSVICTITGLNCVGTIGVTCATWCLIDSSNDLTPESIAGPF